MPSMTMGISGLSSPRTLSWHGSKGVKNTGSSTCVSTALDKPLNSALSYLSQQSRKDKIIPHPTYKTDVWIELIN